jgi:hypothetical protein
MAALVIGSKPDAERGPKPTKQQRRNQTRYFAARNA